MSTWVWILACALVAVSAVAVVLWARGQGQSSRAALPSDWALTPRPVFSNDERRIFRLLLEALPDHVILAKLPLVRFCFPSDPTRVRYWFDLLGATHVAFAVCTVNGRVLAAIDVESPRRGSGRSLQIKQAVLNACRVRYLRLASDAVPSLAELQMLVPDAGNRPPRNLDAARDTLAHTVASRRAARSGWQDSTQAQDSFFAPDTRLDAFASSGFGTLEPGQSRFDSANSDDEIVGVVTEPPGRAGGG